MTNSIKIINRSEFDNVGKKPDQEAVWDSIANPWKTYVVKKIPVVVEFLRLKKGKIVDLGCGTGRNMIASKEIEYFGVDFSAVQLKHAAELIKEKGINAHLFKCGLDKLPKEFRDEMFDYGLFISTLHCMEEKERLKSLKEFYRILKPGAEALISVWNSEDNRFKGKVKDIYMSWEEDGVPYFRYYYLYGKDEFIGLVNDAGFEVIEFYSPREHDRFSKKNWVVRVKKA
jgi:tRNA (uracil-5-)-methyltransferase TRM9